MGSTGYWSVALGPLHISHLLLLFEGGLVLLLLFVLFVGGLGEVHLHLDFRTVCRADVTPQDFISEEGLVQDLIVGSGAAEVLVIDIRLLGWVDPNEVAPALVLVARLTNVLLVPHGGGLLHGLHKDGVLLGVVDCQLLYHLLDLLAGLILEILPIRTLA